MANYGQFCLIFLYFHFILSNITLYFEFLGITTVLPTTEVQTTVTKYSSLHTTGPPSTLSQVEDTLEPTTRTSVLDKSTLAAVQESSTADPPDSSVTQSETPVATQATGRPYTEDSDTLNKTTSAAVQEGSTGDSPDSSVTLLETPGTTQATGKPYNEDSDTQDSDTTVTESSPEPSTLAVSLTTKKVGKQSTWQNMYLHHK